MHKGTGKALCDECKFDQLHCKYCGSLKGKCKHPEICKKHQLFPKMIKYFGFDPEALGSEKIYDEKAITDEDGMVIGTKISDLKGMNVALCSEKSTAAYIILKNLYDNNKISRKPFLNLSYWWQR